MIALIIACHLRIHSIDSHEILAQVICANRRKIDLRRYQICNHRHGRDFDHDAQLNALVEGKFLLPQLLFRLLQQRLGSLNLLYAAHHRQHNP